MILPIDNTILYNDCMAIETNILDDHSGKITGQELAKMSPGYEVFHCDSSTADLLHHYNLLDYTTPGLEQLKLGIIDLFFSNIDTKQSTYYIQMWLNVFREGESIGWHAHHKQTPHEDAWYGFYIVNGEGSETQEESGSIASTNGLLTLFEIDPLMKHRTSPWYGKSKNRITIGYNIYQRPGDILVPIMKDSK